MSHTVHTTIKVRLYPTPAQAALFDATIHCCRYLWNQMLADEQEFYAATGQHYIPAPARYKKSAPFLKEADSQALVSVHQNIQRAFRQFFSNPEQFRYPSFKKKKENRNSYKTCCHDLGNGHPPSIRIEGNGIVLPKAKLVKAKLHRRPLHWWTLKYAVISKSTTGKYYCSLVYEYEAKPKEVPEPETVLGLSYSVRHFYVDSNGYMADPPRWIGENRKRISAMQRSLSRMQKGSQNYEDQLQKLRLLYEHISNQRRDFIHKESRRIANACDAVCVREPNLLEMERNLKLRGIRENGFGMFRYCLEYKLAQQGKRYVEVDRFFPVSKICHVCLCVDDTREQRKQRWACPHCGTSLMRDVNTAVNIREQGLRLMTA